MKKIVFILIAIFLFSETSVSQSEGPYKISHYIDSLITKGIDDKLIPGAIVNFVSHDSVYLNKAYGFSDIKNKYQTESSNTLFQLGSIGKILTVIAVLQQVDAGNLNLQMDVNHYLDDWKIDNPYNQPLTLFHLLTHSGGLNDRVIGYMATSNNNVEPLQMHLEKRMPSLFQSPGVNINYSNYGYGLAGLIVEKITEIPFADYVQQNILDPLHMVNSTYHLPDDYKNDSNYAKGYQLRSSFKEVNIYPKHVVPAGSFISTADDMLKFLRVILKQKGLLSPESYKLMFSTQITNHPMLPGYTLGFEEQLVNGHTIYAKGGQVSGFLSAMVIFTDLNYAIFLSVNTETDNFSTHFWDSVFNYIYPDSDDLSSTSKNVKGLEKYIGNFKNNKTNHNTIEELFSMFMGNVSIIQGRKSDLSLYDSKIKKYNSLKEDVFSNINNSDDRLAFDNDRNKINYLYKNLSIGGLTIPASYSKIPWYEAPDFINSGYPFILLIIPLYLVFFLFWLLLKLISFKRNSLQPKIKIHNWQFHIVALSFTALFLIDILFFFLPLIKDIRSGELFFGLREYFEYFRILHVLLLLFTIVLLINSIRVWKEKQMWLLTKLYYCLFALSSISFLLMLFHWHFFWVNS